MEELVVEEKAELVGAVGAAAFGVVGAGTARQVECLASAVAGIGSVVAATGSCC